MKKVLILGAGYTVKPMVDYFFDRCGYEVTLTSMKKNTHIHAENTHSYAENTHIYARNTHIYADNTHVYTKNTHI